MGKRCRLAEQRQHYQQGLSLLESILVLVIASVITVATFLYYASAKRNKRINAAIMLTQQIITAADNYVTPAKVDNVDGVPTLEQDTRSGPYFTYAGINANVIAKSGLIPEKYIYIASTGGDNGQGEQTAVQFGIRTPWFVGPLSDNSSIITIGFGRDETQTGDSSSDAPGYHIVFNHIPNYACATLKQRLAALETGDTHCQTTTAALPSVTGCDKTTPNQLTLYRSPVGQWGCQADDV